MFLEGYIEWEDLKLILDVLDNSKNEMEEKIKLGEREANVKYSDKIEAIEYFLRLF